MNLATLLSAYISLNLLVVVTLVTLKAFDLFNQSFSSLFNARSLRRLHVVALFLVFAISILSALFPKQPFFQPPVKIWSAASMKSVQQGALSSEGVLQLDSTGRKQGITAKEVSLTGLLVFAMVMTMGLAVLIKDFRVVRKIRSTSHLIRKIGRTRILISDEITVPFGYRSLNFANVIVPTNLISKPVDYRIAVQHELQHHRQGDTLLVYGLGLLRLLCVANPAAHLWVRELSAIQEFACDEALVDLKKVDSHAYASCLFEVAQTAKGANHSLACATGLAFHTQGHLLKRRINTMLFQKPIPTKRSVFFAATAGLVAILTLSAFTSKGLVQDRRITKSMALSMMMNAPGTKDLPITLNDRVLFQLNRYIGTAEGREFMRNALVRMQNERAPIEEALKKYGVPADLLAMPLIESGYENLSQSKSGGRGAGLWQFIPETARKFGLRVEVSGGVDERLDKALLTDAAMRLLVANKMRFDDWTLSVAAYNAGEERVQEGLDKTGSRDAWVLAGKGFEGDHDYLAKLMAAILIMHNPNSVQ